MKTFQLSEKLLKKIADLIQAKKNSPLKKLVKDIHFADMAEIIDELNLDEGVYLIKLFDSEKTSEILTELDDDVREKILKKLSVKEIADEIEELDSDDAADILGELSDQRKEEVISEISDDSLADDLKELLSYEENSAGGLMAKELVKANENWTVTKCLKEGDVEADDSIFQLTKARLPWLFLGLIGGLGSVFILEGFEEVMSHPSYKALFFFTPLIAAMAGNVGVQSSAIIVQGLANDVVKGSLINRLLKELGLSLINGLILSLLTIVFGLATNLPIELSVTISLSMLCVIVVAALIGTSIPIILDKRGIDPAIATGPFITTSNDIFGIFLFFYIAKIILGF